MDAKQLREQLRREKDLEKKALAEWATFLEKTPPNVGVKIDNLFGQHHPNSSSHPWSIESPDIELFCEKDGGPRYFKPSEGYVFVDGRDFKVLSYTCKNCGQRSKTFALMIDRMDITSDAHCEAMKLGEFPPFSSPISKRVAKLLGDEDFELYRKGTRAEAQGLGVGAASYFRRIVDNQWKRLVTEIRDAARTLGVEELAVYERALNEIQFSTAVEMLKDAIPQKLLILDGHNPLTLLYKPLSVQLHTLSDEACLQQAADIRVVLTALLENIGAVLADEKRLKEAADRLRRL